MARKISKHDAAVRVATRWLEDAGVLGDLGDFEVDMSTESNHGVRLTVSFTIGTLDVEVEQDAYAEAKRAARTKAARP